MLKYPHSIHINIVGVLLMNLFGLNKVLYAIKWDILRNLGPAVLFTFGHGCRLLSLLLLVCILAVTSTSNKIIFRNFTV